MTIKKDVHRTGALASILNQADIKCVDVNRLKQPSPTPPISNQNIRSESVSTLANKKTSDIAKSETLIEISPYSCRPWNFSDRHELEMGSIDNLASSIQQAGQQEPALVRPIKFSSGAPEDAHKYEVIFGNRRWKACKLIGKNLVAIVRDLTDQEAALAQKEENEHREDISDYSKAMHYKRLIDEGVFSNENQLAQKLNIPRNRLNDLMAYSRIPAQLLSLIPNPHCIPQRMAIKLASLSKVPENLNRLIQLAPKIAANKITSVSIDKAIEILKSGETPSLPKKSTPIVGRGGAELFTVREDSNGAPCIVLHKASRLAINMDELKSILKNYIDRCIEESFNEETA